MQWHPNRAHGMPSQQEMPNTVSCFWKSVKITTFWTKVDVSQPWDSLNFPKSLENKTFGPFFSCFFWFFSMQQISWKWFRKQVNLFWRPVIFRHSHIYIRSLLGTTHRLFFLCEASQSLRPLLAAGTLRQGGLYTSKSYSPKNKMNIELKQWWFQILLILSPTWENLPSWLIFLYISQIGWNHQRVMLSYFLLFSTPSHSGISGCKTWFKRFGMALPELHWNSATAKSAWFASDNHL